MKCGMVLTVRFWIDKYDGSTVVVFVASSAAAAAASAASDNRKADGRNWEISSEN